MYSYEFKHNKSRLLIVGYGDVGKRILEYKDRFAGFYPFKNIFFDHFRVIIVSRNGLENLDSLK